MSGATFSVKREESFSIIVAEEQITVYEEYPDAVADITGTLADDVDGFIAEVAIDRDGTDDIAVALEQISWQQIIRDMAAQESA
jgi:hypothetical protein